MNKKKEKSRPDVGASKAAKEIILTVLYNRIRGL